MYSRLHAMDSIGAPGRYHQERTTGVCVKSLMTITQMKLAQGADHQLTPGFYNTSDWQRSKYPLHQLIHWKNFASTSSESGTARRPERTVYAIRS